MPLERVLSAIESARKLRLVILDACRDNPFMTTMKRSIASRSIGRGLAQVEPEGGVLVADAATARQQEPYVYGSLPGEVLSFRPQ